MANTTEVNKRDRHYRRHHKGGQGHGADGSTVFNYNAGVTPADKYYDLIIHSIGQLINEYPDKVMFKKPEDLDRESARKCMRLLNQIQQNSKLIEEYK